jgi:hypothetical protein
MSEIEPLRKALIASILDGHGVATAEERRAAFVNSGLREPLRTLVDKVVRNAHAISDKDFEPARASGLGEDHLFEVVICAAVGQATRQYDAARAALDAATGES